MCVCVCVCVKIENKVIQSEEFNVKESRRYKHFGFNKPSSELRKNEKIIYTKKVGVTTPTSLYI